MILVVKDGETVILATYDDAQYYEIVDKYSGVKFYSYTGKAYPQEPLPESATLIPDWHGFRNWCEENESIANAIMAAAATDGRVGVINGYLTDALRQENYENVVTRSNQLDAFVQFSESIKNSVNVAAVTYSLPGPIFEE